MKNIWKPPGRYMSRAFSKSIMGKRCYIFSQKISQLEPCFDGKSTKTTSWRADPNLDLGDDDLHNCQDQLAPVGIVPVIFMACWEMEGKWTEN